MVVVVVVWGGRERRREGGLREKEGVEGLAFKGHKKKDSNPRSGIIHAILPAKH